MTKTKTAKAKAAAKRAAAAQQKSTPCPPPPSKAMPKKAQPKKGKGGSKGTPVSYAKNLGRKVGNNTIQTRISGSDILYEVRTGASAPATSVVASILSISPATILSGSRLRQFAPLFQRFRFSKFNLRYKPQVSTSFTGNVAVGYIADPTQELAGVDLTLMQQVSELPFRYVGLSWKEGGMNIKPSDMVPAPGMKFTCDPTEEADNIETYQGRLFFITDNLTTVNTLYGRWILEWEVEFYDPIITKALNASYAFGTGGGSNPAQAHPWGTSFTGVIGDNDLMYMSDGITDTVCTFPTNGTYILYVYYPTTAGGAGLTASSSMSVSSGSTLGSTSIFYCDAQVGKFWKISLTMADNGTFSIHDTAGTHPNAGPTIFVARTGPGPNATFSLSKKKLAREIFELKQLISDLTIKKQQVVTPPAFPSFPGIQAVDQSQTSMSIVGEITDNNNPPKFIEMAGSESGANGTITVAVAPAGAKEKKKKPKFQLLPIDSDGDS